MDVTHKWLRGLAVAAMVAAAAAMSVVIIEAPAAIGFALSVGLACGWCYWLENRSDIS